MAYDRSVHWEGGSCWSGPTGLPISVCRAFVQLDMKAIFAEKPPPE